MFPSIIRHRRIITVGKALLCALVFVTASFALSQPQARAAATSRASGVSVLVPSTAQWVNTGINLNNGDQLGITATGSWSPGPTFGNVGPDGFTQPNADNFLNLQDIGSCASCASTPTPHFAGLIGYIGNAPPPPGSYTSTNILSEAKKVFFVGSNFGISNAVTGTLWLNFNDDAYSNNTGDNAGQVTAAVTDTPSTQPLGGTWINPANGFIATRGKLLHLAAHAFGGAGVNHVNFTIWWPAIGNNPWFVACKVYTPKSGTTDEYDCDWNLKDGNGKAVPTGTIKVGFDVYDNAQQRILSPDGVRQGTITSILTSTNPIWAGYADNGRVNGPQNFSDVKGSWTVPSVNCGLFSLSDAKIWVGIDGFGGGPVEQTGISATCVSKKAVYFAWYEMFPSPLVPLLNKSVKPGDRINAEVRYIGGGKFVLSLNNTTQKWQFSTTQTNQNAPRITAEWIVEGQLPGFASLTQFSTISFSNCSVDGQSITSTLFTSQLTMVQSDGTVRAQPTNLKTNNTAFSVSWKHG